MSIINYAARVINFKIVYYGPGLAGKTAGLVDVARQVETGAHQGCAMAGNGDFHR